MNSTVTSQIPNGRFLCSIQFAQNTFVRGCPNFTFFATIQKVLKNRETEKKNMLIHCPNKWQIHSSSVPKIGNTIWKYYLRLRLGKKLTARKSKIFAGCRVANFCRNGLWFTHNNVKHKFTWRCSWNLMGKICVMAAFALEFQTVQDGPGL